jgi:hypothetical protein
MSFLRTLSSLLRTREGLVGRSPIAPSQARLTLEFFMMGFQKRSCNLLVWVSLSILLNLRPGCHTSGGGSHGVGGAGAPPTVDCLHCSSIKSLLKIGGGRRGRREARGGRGGHSPSLPLFQASPLLGSALVRILSAFALILSLVAPYFSCQSWLRIWWAGGTRLCFKSPVTNKTCILNLENIYFIFLTYLLCPLNP